MTDRTLYPDRLNALLVNVCGAAGIDHHGAELIKFTNNAVFKIPKSGVVVRIAGSSAIEGRVPKILQVAAWLAEHDVPAVRLLPGHTQPLHIDGHVATLWTLVSAQGTSPTGTDIGRLLHIWHNLPLPSFALPNWRPLDAIRARLAEPNPLQAHERKFLNRRAGEIEDDLAGVQFVLPPGPIWGDAFLGNLIPNQSGPIACDFDGAAYGPREWDLTPVAVGAARFNYPKNDHSLLSSEYGFDVSNWNGFAVLRQLRELQLVTSVLPVLLSNPGLTEQWRHRFDTFTTGSSARWTPYV